MPGSALWSSNFWNLIVPFHLRFCTQMNHFMGKSLGELSEKLRRDRIPLGFWMVGDEGGMCSLISWIGYRTIRQATWWRPQHSGRNNSRGMFEIDTSVTGSLLATDHDWWILTKWQDFIVLFKIYGACVVLYFHKFRSNLQLCFFECKSVHPFACLLFSVPKPIWTTFRGWLHRTSGSDNFNFIPENTRPATCINRSIIPVLTGSISPFYFLPSKLSFIGVVHYH